MEQHTERVGRNGVTLRHLMPAMAHTLATLADDAGIAMYLRDVFPHPYTKQDAVNYINFISQAKHAVAGASLKTAAWQVLSVCRFRKIYTGTQPRSGTGLERIFAAGE